MFLHESLHEAFFDKECYNAVFDKECYNVVPIFFFLRLYTFRFFCINTLLVTQIEIL